MAESAPNLRSLFQAAKSQEAELQHLDGSGYVYRDKMHSTIDMFEECRLVIQQLSIFSHNETSDELVTSAIQFLGVDYLLANLLLRSYDADRRKLLQKATGLFADFLVRLNAYELLSKQNQRLLEQYQDHPDAFQLASPKDATNRRQVKVTRYQEEKALKTKLELLRAQSSKHSVDEETIRHLSFTELELFASQSFEALDMIVQEDTILSQAQGEPPNGSAPTSDPRQEDRADNDGYSERLEGPVSQARRGGPLLTKDGKPLQPFTITDKRNQLLQGVFRPSHNLPTMSIDDYLEEEKRRGGIADGGAESQQPAPEPDEDDMKLADQEIMKARAWDDYVEATPKGSGNTLNRG